MSPSTQNLGNANEPPKQGSSLHDIWDAPDLMGKIKMLASWWNNTRIARALTRYTKRSGGLISSGMSLTMILSLSASLTVGWTIFSAVLGSNETLRDGIVLAINYVMPGLMKTSPNDPTGIVDPQALTSSSVFSLTSLIAFLVALWTAMSLVGSLGISIRSMFGLVTAPLSPIQTITRNIIGVMGVCISFLIGGGSNILLNLFGTWLFSSFHINSRAESTTLLVASNIISFCITYFVAILLIRVVAMVRPPRRDLLIGSAFIATMSLLLSFLGTSAVTSIRGPVLATAASLVTLVLWINIQMRVILIVSAWIANPPAVPPTDQSTFAHINETPNYVTLTSPPTLDWPHHPVTGEIEPTPVDPSPPKTTSAETENSHMSPRMQRSLRLGQELLEERATSPTSQAPWSRRQREEEKEARREQKSIRLREKQEEKMKKLRENMAVGERILAQKQDENQ